MPDAAEALFLSGEIEVKSFSLSVDPVTAAALFGYVLVPEVFAEPACLCFVSVSWRTTRSISLCGARNDRTMEGYLPSLIDFDFPSSST